MSAIAPPSRSRTALLSRQHHRRGNAAASRTPKAARSHGRSSTSDIHRQWSSIHKECFGIRGIATIHGAAASHPNCISDTSFPNRRFKIPWNPTGFSSAADNAEPNHNHTNDASPSLIDTYRSLVQAGEVSHDPHQVRALHELDRLRNECLAHILSDQRRHRAPPSSPQPPSTYSRLFSFTPSWANPYALSDAPPPSPRGVYLHGGVGCGKTYCMDLFYRSLLSSPHHTPSRPIVQKVHFHKFMLLDVHRAMHRAKTLHDLSGNDLFPHILRSILQRGRILCFDEFQVTDVADALLLKRLFTGLFDEGAVVVATSNRPPRELYLGGLQRELFLPFVDLLEERLAVVGMWESEMDYRLVGREGGNTAQRVYFVQGEDGDGKAREEFEALFLALTKGGTVGSVVLEVSGRQVLVPQASEEYNIARFSFYDLCGKAKGAADYLAIGERFNTIFIEDVPRLKFHEVNLVRRWITLIDALYECHVKVVVLAETSPEDMFEVDLANRHCDEVFAFDRTRSRMEEMRSEGYLKKKWVGAKHSS